MDISTIANLLNAVAVTAGVIFAATQIRDYRRQRRREELVLLAGRLGDHQHGRFFLLLRAVHQGNVSRRNRCRRPTAFAFTRLANCAGGFSGWHNLYRYFPATAD